jgi:1-acyl-sn-glycerol-3-phosphate acyltransferase
MEEGTKHLKAGTSIFIFPEGTRTKDGNIHRYKDGAFRLAQENGVAIAPCVLDGTKGLFKGGRLNSRRLVVRILDPIPAERVAATPARELAEQVRALSVEALAEVREGNK